MKKTISLLALLLCVAMMLSLAACGGSGSSSAGSSTAADPAADAGAVTAAETVSGGEGNTLTVGTLDAADGFDPTTNSNCGLGLMLVYDTILYRNTETGDIEPMLAESWEFTDDTTLVLKIREGVTFSNGETMTPEDVLYSLWRFVYVNNQFSTGYDVIDFDNSTIDGNTLTLKLLSSYPDIVTQLANDRFACVVCKSYVESTGDDAFWDKPVGTGPYVCVENVNGSHSSYERRDDYWGDLPEAESITIRNYSELTTMMVDFDNKVLDLVLDVGETDYNIALDGGYGDDVTGKLFPTYDILAITMPEYVELFDNENVRKAVALALDTAAITNRVYGSLGTVADSSLIPGVQGYTAVGVNEYDPDAARELLAGEGYPTDASDPDAIQLLCLFPALPANEMTATIVQAQLAEIGIKVTVDTGDFATVIPRLMNNECELGLFGTGGGTYTALNIYSTVRETSTNAAARVTDETFNGYLNDASGEMNESVRVEDYENAQAALADTYRFIPIAYANAANLYHNSIDNVIGTVARGVSLRYVTFN